MPALHPPPSLAGTLADIGEAGIRLAALGAAEGTAGNISVFLTGEPALPPEFAPAERIGIDPPAPELSGGLLVATGSGCRLRSIAADPGAFLGILRIEAGGSHARLHASPRRRFERLSSELTAHIAVQAEHAATSGGVHAVVHAQPRHLTYLSHLDRYREARALTQSLFRWQAETLVLLPNGLGVVPFMTPGAPELAEATSCAMRRHEFIVWSKHGVLVRCAGEVQRACDLIEVIETAAHYQCLDLACGERAHGLEERELLRVCDFWRVKQTVF